MPGASQNQAGKILSQIKQSLDVQEVFFSSTCAHHKGIFSSGGNGSGEGWSEAETG
jgi:hypothetical protein